MTLRRHQLLSWVVAIGLIALAAAGLKLSESEPKAQIIHGQLDQIIAVNDGTVQVSDVRVATALRQYGDTSDHTGVMFVVLTLRGTATGGDSLSLTNSQLLSGDAVYETYSSGHGISVDPGFAATRDLVFEVDPVRISGLTLKLTPFEIISGYQQHVEVFLGITAGNAAQWRAIAQHQVVEPAADQTEALP